MIRRESMDGDDALHQLGQVQYIPFSVVISSRIGAPGGASTNVCMVQLVALGAVYAVTALRSAQAEGVGECLFETF